MEILSIFEHRCLHSFDKLRQNNRTGNPENRASGSENHLIGQALEVNWLLWLVHMVRILSDQLPRSKLFSEAGNGGKIS